MRRVALWRAGRFGNLQREAVAERTARSTGDGGGYSRTDRGVDLVREGALGRAVAIAQAHGIVQDPEEARRALEALQPPRRHYPDFIPPAGPARIACGGGPSLEMKHLSVAIKRMPRLSTAHVDGWRWEHVRDVAAHGGAEALLSYVRTVARADVPEVIADFLASATLYPFLKKDLVTVGGPPPGGRGRGGCGQLCSPHPTSCCGLSAGAAHGLLPLGGSPASIERSNGPLTVLPEDLGGSGEGAIRSAGGHGGSHGGFHPALRHDECLQ